MSQRTKATAKSEIAFSSAAELASLFSRRKLSPVELAEYFFARIETFQPQLNAFITATRDRAFADARASERRYRNKKPLGPLDGIPITLKDNIWTARIRSTAGAKILANFIPDSDASVAARLRRAGTILLGKTNMHEFAYGVSTENPHFGAAHNPWSLSHSTGGSSGGSAAAVSAGLCVASVGTDTGGSIRIPSALCGIVGLKPTFGRVSCFGTVPLAPTFDHVGPIARSVGDAALVFAAITGRDPEDPNTLAHPILKNFSGFHAIESRLRLRKRGARPVILGLPREYFFDRIDPEVRSAVKSAVSSLESAGARIEEISLPGVSEGDEPSTTIALAEATHVHRAAEWFPSRAAEYGEDVRKRLELGVEIRATDYLAAKEACARIRCAFDAALEKVDAILAPTTPMAAPAIGEKVVSIGGSDEPVRGALIRLNRPANLTGHPAISLPCVINQAGLPIGLQIIGRAWQEPELLAIAALYESIRPEMELRPPDF